MPVSPTYPGVYIQEVPSGVRTITGVATSITAFLGRAKSGMINEPVTINSFADFERQFGGLAVDYPLSYTVRDFYLNGGSQAIIVRLFRAPSASEDGKTALTIDGVLLSAKSPGAWGNEISATIDVEVSEEVRTRLGLAPADALFNLTIGLGTNTEKFLNVTVTDNARRIDRVLNAESSLVEWKGAWPTATPEMPKVVEALAKFNELNIARNEWSNAKNATPPVPATIEAAKAAYEAANDSYDTAKDDLDEVVTTKGSKGDPLDQTTYEGSKDNKTGLYALEKADLFNLLCIPPDTREGDVPIAIYQKAMSYCQERRAMLIVDAPASWSANKETAANTARDGLAALSLTGEASRNAALYFPRVLEADPLRDGQIDTFVPCGIIAGIMARTDTSRGVWKAPAGLDSSMNGIQGVNVNLTDDENGLLNPLAINCLRAFPINGRVVWGARTLRGADQLADEWKYIPVRRTALFIEESLYRGTQWVVFEPNDEPLWSQIRLNIGAFMHNLFRQGAFQGATPKQAYFVKCDKETTTQNDINLGIVNIVVGFAPLKPAEFVIIKLQQIAGELEV